MEVKKMNWTWSFDLVIIHSLIYIYIYIKGFYGVINVVYLYIFDQYFLLVKSIGKKACEKKQNNIVSNWVFKKMIYTSNSSRRFPRKVIFFLPVMSSPKLV